MSIKREGKCDIYTSQKIKLIAVSVYKGEIDRFIRAICIPSYFNTYLFL